MKHRAKGRKLGRKKDPRKALMKSLMEGLIEHGKIKTTEAKAKEVRPKIEKFVTKAGMDTLANRRFLAKYLSVGAVKKMMGEIGPKYNKRKGGYTRIIKMGARKGDASPMAVIEFV